LNKAAHFVFLRRCDIQLSRRRHPALLLTILKAAILAETTGWIMNRSAPMSGAPVQRRIQLREYRQHYPSPSLRPGSESAKGTPIVGLSERIYEPTKLAALFDMLSSEGHPARDILKNVNLPVKEVHSSKTRISLKQLMTACKNALRLSKDRHLATSRLHRGRRHHS
jgi:hypothetical protein